MSYADKLFIENCHRIISVGDSDEKFEVRPKWEDGTPAHTVKNLYVVDRYQLSQTSIPIMTMRKTAFKSCIDEILWIYQKASNKIEDLNSHIWDEWNVGDGTIGKAYGYQMSLLHRHHRYRRGENWDGYASIREKDGWVYMNQIDAVIWDLKHNPGSRSIMTNLYNHHDLSEMGLRPCAYSMTFNVTKDGAGNMVLNGMLNQRSQDMLVANNWNTVQYSVLLHMLAQVCDMQVGTFVHIIADAHIYDRHIPVVKDMIARYGEIEKKWIIENGEERYREISAIPWLMDKEDIPHKNPKFWINPKVTDFYQFTTKDFALEGYEYESFDMKIPVAV